MTSPSSYRDVIDGDSGHRSRVTPQLADVGQPEQVPDDAGAVPRAWGGAGRCYKGGVVNIRPAGMVSGGITYHIFILNKCYKRVISHHNQYKNTSTFRMKTFVPNQSIKIKANLTWDVMSDTHDVMSCLSCHVMSCLGCHVWVMSCLRCHV